MDEANLKPGNIDGPLVAEERPHFAGFHISTNSEEIPSSKKIEDTGANEVPRMNNHIHLIEMGSCDPF
jgi:hypothetical protein